MTNIIQVRSDFRRARVSCIKTRPDAIASVSVRRVPGPQLRVSFVRKHDIAGTLPTGMRIEGRAVGDLASGSEASFVGILPAVGRSGHVHEQACVSNLRSRKPDSCGADKDARNATRAESNRPFQLHRFVLALL